MSTHDEVLPAPALRPCIDLWVDVGVPIDVGAVQAGTRRVVPIVGGRAVGLLGGWTARVMDGGADYQVVASATCTLLHARYVLETDAGDRIYVENNALRCGPADLMARLQLGQVVDPAAIYFRCQPRLEASSKTLRWMNERVFVGTGARQPNQVVMRFFELM